MFNDSIRDGLKGSVFNAKDRGYISGKVDKETAQRVIFGLIGGAKGTIVSWYVPDNAVINYMSCHDNHTLFDRLLASNPDDPEEERLKMYRFGASVIMIGKGIPFFLAGEDMLRSKGGDSNSYKSGDEVNNIRWDDLTQGSEVMKMRDFYRALIALRKANGFITGGKIECGVLDDNSITVSWTQDGKPAAWALINPGAAKTVTLPEGNWQALLLNEAVDPQGAQTVSGTVEIEGRTVLLVRAE